MFLSSFPNSLNNEEIYNLSPPEILLDRFCLHMCRHESKHHLILSTSFSTFDVYHVTLVCLPSFPSFFFINFLLKVALLSVIITILTGVCCKERPSETYKPDSRPTWHRKNCHFRSDCISYGQTRPGASRSNFIFAICISFCYYTYDYKFFCQVLVCAPSNVAVDQLAEKISATGLKVMKKSFCLQLC